MRAILPIVVIMLLCIPVAVAAQGHVPPSADNHLETFDTAVAALQATNYASNGRYMQWLRRQSTDTGPRCPSDQAACPEIPGAPDTPKIDYVVNVYLSDSGAGFECVGYYYANDDVIWKRVINHGPETWREHDWKIVAANEVEN